MSSKSSARRPAREDAYNEFKSADALKDPALIARAVVAFLNADGGGDVWIGVNEERDGTISEKRIPDAEAATARDTLRDHLIDTIEPALHSDEFRIDVTEHGLLVVHVEGRKLRRPYAQLVKRGRWFGIRVGNRVREMTRDEIFDGRVLDEDGEAKAVSLIEQKQAEAARTHRGLWLRMEPTEPLAIDFGDPNTQEEFTRWLRDRGAADNLPSAWSYLVSRGVGNLNLFPAGTHCKLEVPNLKKLEISSAGSVTFTVAEGKIVRPHLETSTLELSPYAILGYPTSIFRLVSRILNKHAARKTGLRMVVGMVIGGVEHASLYPGSPRDPFYEEEHGRRAGSDVLVLEKPLARDRDEIVEKPDRCALSLVRWLYENCFEFEANDIPPEFDRERGILTLS